MDHLTPAQAAERRRGVRSDAARKRGSLWFILHGQPVPVKYLRRETEEFDARHGVRLGSRMGEGSSTHAEASSPLLPRRLELDEGSEEYEPAALEDAIGPDDFVSDDIFEYVTSVVQKRSVAEERDVEKRCRVDAECDDILLEQGILASLKQKEKAEEWETEVEKQKAVFVDLDPDE